MSEVKILDSRGVPLSNGHELNGTTNSKPGFEKAFLAMFDSYLQSLSNSRLPALSQAREPFKNHAWIFAAAMTAAIVGSQAPLTVFRETASSLRLRGAVTRRAGRRRRAMRRHQRASSRLFHKGLVVMEDHPAVDLLDSPNPYQDGLQLQQLTIIMLMVRGEAFWIKTGSEGRKLAPGAFPEQLWPIDRHLMRPLFGPSGGSTRGQLSGWRLDLPEWFPGAERTRRVDLGLSEVIQMKLPNIDDLVRGMSRLTPAATHVEADLLIQKMNRSILEKQGVPRGVVEYPGDLKRADRDEIEEKWAEKHEGAENAGRLAILSGGFKFNPVALDPASMLQMDHLKWNRETLLATMNIPPSVLGVTEFLNYSNQLGQDRNLWDKNLLPMMTAIERSLDHGLFYGELDDLFALFDLSQVEAMLSGVKEKIEAATMMCGVELHAPPRVAYRTVGLDVETYEGDDLAIMKGIASTVADATQADTGPDFEPVPIDEFELPDNLKPRTKARGGKVWKEFVKLQAQYEVKARKAWRKWVADQKRATLDRFDEAAARTEEARTRVTTRQLDLTFVLGDLAAQGNELKVQFRPVMLSLLQDTFEFTVEEIGGVPIVSIDDESILAMFEAREAKLIATAPATVRKALVKTLADGLSAGETLNQLRQRVASVYEITASSAKSLQVARTETAGFMNGVRHEMFKGQGITETEWTTAGDEKVRDDHVTFGESGPHESGFNYLTLVGGVGTLEFPGDPRAPGKQTINCRCVEIPRS